MKTIHSTLILCLALAGMPLRAADAPATPAAGDLVALEKFLTLDDAQLDDLQRAIARVRAMTPAERTKLREQIVQFRQLPAAERQAWRQGWGQMPAELRDGWREMMQSADDAQRAEIHRRLEALPPAERVAARKKMVEEFLRTHAKP
ncbi:MAG: DUF3106 domain-containing protein [Opitutae bacterium]|nr:DUF3106 domain-containing protein [Opitutae bacterium]